jgi:hypothetical protein
MRSNGGSQTATLATLVRVSSVDLTSERRPPRRDETCRHSLVKEVSVAGPNQSTPNRRYSRPHHGECGPCRPHPSNSKEQRTLEEQYRERSEQHRHADS